MDWASRYTYVISQENTSADLGYNTFKLGEVGPVISTVCQLCRSMIEVPTFRLVDSKCFPPWRLQTGSGLPDRSLVYPTAEV